MHRILRIQKPSYDFITTEKKNEYTRIKRLCQTNFCIKPV